MNSWKLTGFDFICLVARMIAFIAIILAARIKNTSCGAYRELKISICFLRTSRVWVKSKDECSSRGKWKRRTAPHRFSFLLYCQAQQNDTYAALWDSTTFKALIGLSINIMNKILLLQSPI